MRKKMHTIWVTTLTLIVLMLSSVATSAPVIPLQMFAASQMTIAADSHDTHCMPYQESRISSEQECCDADSMVSEHQCCSTSCSTSYIAVTSLVRTYHQPFSLGLITKDTVRRASSVSNVFYRPPIA